MKSACVRVACRLLKLERASFEAQLMNCQPGEFGAERTGAGARCAGKLLIDVPKAQQL